MWEMGVNPPSPASVRYSQTEDFPFPSAVGSMLSLPQPLPKICPCSNPPNQIFFGKEVFMNLIKRSPCTTKKGIKSKSSVLLRDRTWETGRGEKMALRKWRQRMEWCHQKPRNAWRIRSWKIENDSPQSRGRGAWPVNPLISDFGYRTVREYISGENSAGKVVVVCMAALGK